MKERALGMAKKLQRDFMAFTPGQRAVTIVAGLAVIIGGYLFATWAGKPTYAPLFTNLAPSDASAIVDKLNSAKKPYQLSAAGTEILVPQSDVYSERLTMSAAGLPTSGQSGYSLLDKEGITTSEFVQHVDYQRALEGELDNTMTAISGVQTAQVHLAIPDNQNVFNDNTQKTTAAVLLGLAPGATLTTDQVRSVVNLVSSSVPGLTSDQVTVSDTTGKVLSTAGTGIDGAGSASQSEATQAYNARTQNLIQSILTPILGAGHFSVTVNAKLNFDTDTTTANSYTYDPSVPPLAVSSANESYSGTGANQGSNAVLGAATPTPSATPSGTGGGQYDKTTVVQNNAVGTKTDTRVVAPGGVEQQGVSVVLDKAAMGSIDEATVSKLVTSAAALDTTRGDTLAIATLPFDTKAAEQQAAIDKAAKAAAAKAASSKQLMELIKTGLVVAAIAAAVIITIIMGRRRKPGAGADTDDNTPDDLDNFLAGLNSGEEPADVRREPAMRVPGAMDSPEAIAQRQAVSELADEQPDDVARMLRNWMNTKGS